MSNRFNYYFCCKFTFISLKNTYFIPKENNEYKNLCVYKKILIVLIINILNKSLTFNFRQRDEDNNLNAVSQAHQLGIIYKNFLIIQIIIDIEKLVYFP